MSFPHELVAVQSRVPLTAPVSWAGYSWMGVHSWMGAQHTAGLALLFTSPRVAVPAPFPQESAAADPHREQGQAWPPPARR